MYIVLLDTHGSGLTTFSWGLLTIEEKNLKDYIIDAFLEILGYENMEQYLADDPDPLKADGMWTDSFADSIVILSLMDKYKRQPLEDFIEKTIDDEINSKSKIEYKEYLRLKQKFEKKEVK